MLFFVFLVKQIYLKKKERAKNEMLSSLIIWLVTGQAKWILKVAYRFDIEKVEQSAVLRSSVTNLSNKIADGCQISSVSAAKLLWLFQETYNRFGKGIWAILALRELLWQWGEPIDVLRARSVISECHQNQDLPGYYQLLISFGQKWPHFGSRFDPLKK